MRVNIIEEIRKIRRVITVELDYSARRRVEIALSRIESEHNRLQIYINRLLQENSALLSIPGVMEALAEKEKHDEEEVAQRRESSRQSSDVSGMSTWFQDD